MPRPHQDLIALRARLIGKIENLLTARKEDHALVPIQDIRHLGELRARLRVIEAFLAEGDAS